MYKRIYFENQIYCGECTGGGCKHCGGFGIQTISEYIGNRPSGDPIALAVSFRRALRELLSNRFA